MVSAIISRLVILLFGTLYPAYASYKAVRTKNVKEYVKWMMYWITFALFCSVETFSDVFLSWMPFYYELKILFVLWMLSPMTQGSSFLFKKFVHPQLARREKDIDEMIEQASKQGYSTLVSLGTKGLNYASQVVLKTALMGQSKLVDHVRRSYSTSDLTDDGHHLQHRHRALDQEGDGDDELDNRLIEDNEELDNRAKSSGKARTSAGLVLTSVKEEEGEGEESIITETYVIPSNVKRHYTQREGQAEPSQQSQDQGQSLLPPESKALPKPKPLHIAATNLRAKRDFFAKFQSQDNDPQTSSSIESKNSSQTKYLSRRAKFTRSLSDTSVLTRFSPAIQKKQSRGRIGDIVNRPTHIHSVLKDKEKVSSLRDNKDSNESLSTKAHRKDTKPVPEPDELKASRSKSFNSKTESEHAPNNKTAQDNSEPHDRSEDNKEAAQIEKSHFIPTIESVTKKSKFDNLLLTEENKLKEQILEQLADYTTVSSPELSKDDHSPSGSDETLYEPESREMSLSPSEGESSDNDSLSVSKMQTCLVKQEEDAIILVPGPIVAQRQSSQQEPGGTLNSELKSSLEEPECEKELTLKEEKGDSTSGLSALSRLDEGNQFFSSSLDKEMFDFMDTESLCSIPESIESSDFDDDSEMSDSSSIWETVSEMDLRDYADTHYRHPRPSLPSYFWEDVSQSAPSSPAVSVRAIHGHSTSAPPSPLTQLKTQQAGRRSEERSTRQTSSPTLYSPTRSRRSESPLLSGYRTDPESSSYLWHSQVSSSAPSGLIPANPASEAALWRLRNQNNFRSKSLDLGRKKYTTPPRPSSSRSPSYKRASSVNSRASSTSPPSYPLYQHYTHRTPYEHLYK